MDQRPISQRDAKADMSIGKHSQKNTLGEEMLNPLNIFGLGAHFFHAST
jgi:hypothetical protein